MRITHIAVSALLIGMIAAPEVIAKKQSPSKVPPVPAACTDFYDHVNTAWLRSNPLPPGDASRSRWNELFELSARQRESLFSAPLTNGGRAQQQLNALMQNTNEAIIQTDSAKILSPILSDIDRIKKISDLNTVIAKLHARGIHVVFDFKANEQPTFSASGLGLPEATFYTGTHPDLLMAQGQYRTYIESVLTASGARADKVSAQSAAILAIETQLANAASDTQQQTISAKNAAKEYINLNLIGFIKEQKVSNETLAIKQTNFFRTLNTSFNAKNIESWKSYLRFHAVNQLAPYLGAPYFEQHGKFYDVFIAGKSAPKSRQEIMRELIETASPDLIDAAYAERYINAEQKKRALNIALQMIETAKVSSTASTWLGAANKAQTFDTLKTMRVDIGRKDYETKNLDVGMSMSTNASNLLRRSSAQNDWPANWSDSTPLIAYLPKQNRILVSQALLQERMMDADSAAVDYGAFGALLAQQLSVALYSQGMRDANDINPQRLAITTQYDAYPLSANKKVNGALTATQNLADLSGLELAYKAFNASATRDKVSQQAFFQSWAHVWARIDRDSALVAASSKSIHAPYKFRVNGPLSNMPSFAAVYDCKVGTMQRVYKDQIKIWP
jgi:putative endopeptidase